MKALITSLGLALSLSAALATWPADASAKRLGGGKAVGMQRQSAPSPASPAPANPGPNNAAGTQSGGANSAAAPVQNAAAKPAAAPTSPTTATAPAAPAKRSWMGPLAGLAAGLGLAALFSHFGMGEALASMVTGLLLVLVIGAVLIWLARRFLSRPANAVGQSALAGAGAFGGASYPPGGSFESPTHRAGSDTDKQSFSASPGHSAGFSSGSASTTAGAAFSGPDSSAPALPPEAQDALSRVARTLFIRLQAANDAGDLQDLRQFTTPELFAALQLDLLDRGPKAQRTEVLQVNAQVLEAVTEAEQQVVSVRFDGLIREEAQAPASRFAEVWHLVQARNANNDWRIAGITPLEVA